MAIISRQTGLISAESWKKVYQTFRDADFTSYDFETLRKSMIDYIKLNYPEDFNDFTESSEFVALIDLIAFFGQSLAFRADLNARENFIDTAERRDSILKLARLISYNPKRNVAASGYLKIESISVSESVFDSDGTDLANQFITFNDAGNENWLEQFTAVLNSCLVSTQTIGKPAGAQIIGGVRTEEYGINVDPAVVPVYRFDAQVEGRSTTFEIVSATSIGKRYVYESAPDFGKPFNFLYMNDGLGNSSNGTGFFLFFKQGELRNLNFSVNELIPNKIVNIDTDNVNNSDVWLYSLLPSGFTENLWEPVPAVAGVNIIYNSLEKRNLYQVNTRATDQISLVFGDGAFSNIPQGNFRAYYRVSNGLTYRITPDEMRGITISLNYVSKNNRTETLTIRASLRYTVANASARETIEEIKQRAPQQYYTQNRMITGEDYNILPYTMFPNIRNIKSINRTSSGLSRYLDVLDTTGKYSSTNIFGEDGVLYMERTLGSYSFNFANKVEIRKIMRNKVIPEIVAGKELLHHYYYHTTPENPIRTQSTASEMVNGERYTIAFVGSTDFTSYGSATNGAGVNFVADKSGNQTYTYKVVENATTSFAFSNTAVVNNPTITARSGDKIIFEISTPNQPFWIKTIRGIGTANGVTVGDITNNGITNGKIMWDTTGVPAGLYYYVSQNLVGMGGTIIITDFGTGRVTTNMKWNLSTIGDSSVSGYFTYNNKPVGINFDDTTIGQGKYFRQGALIRFVSPIGYHFNAVSNLVPGPIQDVGDTTEIFAAILQVTGDGTNNGQGNFINGLGPVVMNGKVPSGAIVDYVIPVYKNSLSDELVNICIDNIASYITFGLKYDKVTMAWSTISAEQINYDSTWLIKFDYNNLANTYTIYYRAQRYVFYSPLETNFFYDDSLQTYDGTNNSVIRDHIKILGINHSLTDKSRSLGRDFVWQIYKPIVQADGYVENKSIYLTMADTNNDSVPDYPYLFESIVSGMKLKTSVEGIKNNITADEYGAQINQLYLTYLGRNASQSELDAGVNGIIFEDKTISSIELTIRQLSETIGYQAGALFSNELVFFQNVENSYGNFKSWRLIDSRSVISNLTNVNEILTNIRSYDRGQLFYIKSTNQFFRVEINSSGQKILSNNLNTSRSSNYVAHIGRQRLYYQYRHNSPNTRRIDPSISNIVDIYVLTAEYDTSYRRYITDSAGMIAEPLPPTTTELQVMFNDLEKYKAISDTMIFHSAVFKPLFGNKAENNLQAIFKVVKNDSISQSDAEVKASVIASINRYFDTGNFDFGETFYFSELAAYLHRDLSPNIASIIIVPKNPASDFGSLYQINAEANEIIISAATVDDVEVINSITASQLNQNLALVNRSFSV